VKDPQPPTHEVENYRLHNQSTFVQPTKRRYYKDLDATRIGRLCGLRVLHKSWLPQSTVVRFFLFRQVEDLSRMYPGTRDNVVSLT
jgi:hypothetical protein